MRSACLALAAGLLGVATGPAAAQEGKAFYDGKTVTYIVSTDPGGGYDTYGRLVARYLQKYLPGSTFVVRNMPGAGNLIGANYINASEPDGLTIGTFNTGLLYGQIAGQEGIRFDLEDMSWIGKAAAESRVFAVDTRSDIMSFEQLLESDEPVRFASAGIGTSSMVELTLLSQLMELPIDIITGYQGNEERLAISRGEVVGTLAYRSSYEPSREAGELRFIAEIGGDGADTPNLSDFTEDQTALRAIDLIASQNTIGRLTVGPPNIPADRLDALREAYGEVVVDPEFLADAEGLGLPIDPLIGDELAAAVSAALDQPPEVADLLGSILN